MYAFLFFPFSDTQVHMSVREGANLLYVQRKSSKQFQQRDFRRTCFAFIIFTRIQYVISFSFHGNLLFLRSAPNKKAHSNYTLTEVQQDPHKHVKRVRQSYSLQQVAYAVLCWFQLKTTIEKTIYLVLYLFSYL